MLSPDQRIAQLKAQGTLSDADYELLKASIKPRKPGLRTWFFRPFDQISGGKTLALGASLLLIISAAAQPLSIHFPGVIDFKLGLSLPFIKLVLQNLVAVCMVSLTFYLGALLFKQRHLRFIDFFGSLALARMPYLVSIGILGFSSLFTSIEYNKAIVTAPVMPPVLIISIISLIPILIWMLILDFEALKTSSGLNGSKLWTVYGVGLIVAEVAAVAINMTFIL